MKKIGKGLISILAVLLISTGFTVNQAQASTTPGEPIAEPSNYYNIRDLRTFPVVGNGYTTRGAFVGALQSNLWASGYSSTVGSVDKIFGPATRSGVLSFQRKYGLAVDGIVGRGTWGKMDQMASIANSHGFRTFRGSSANYHVIYQEGSSSGGANSYYLINTKTGGTISSGQMWITPVYPIPQKLLNEPLVIKPPTSEELEELDIPVNLNYSSKDYIAAQGDPEILVYDEMGEKSVITWVHTDANPILVSESTYGTGVEEMVKKAASWHANYDVEITEFKGYPMVVSNKGDGIFEIHIVIPEKLFTVGGAKKDSLLSIAEEINIK